MSFNHQHVPFHPLLFCLRGASLVPGSYCLFSLYTKPWKRMSTRFKDAMKAHGWVMLPLVEWSKWTMKLANGTEEYLMATGSKNSSIFFSLHHLVLILLQSFSNCKVFLCHIYHSQTNNIWKTKGKPSKIFVFVVEKISHRQHNHIENVYLWLP